MLGLGLGRLGLQRQSGGPTPTPTPVVGVLPALPASPDRVVTNRAQLVQAIADAGTTLPANAKIAIDASVLDLGQTNISAGGFTDQTVAVNKAVTIYPLAGYGPFDTNPHGDANHYARRFQRLTTIKGFLNVSANAKIYGIKFTSDNAPAPSTKTVKSGWETVGLANNSPYIKLSGSASPEIVGCEFEGPFGILDPTEKLWDCSSPSQWQFVADRGSIVAAGDPLGVGVIFTGHGDADWPCYNRLIEAPMGINAVSWAGTSVLVDQCYFHDLGAHLGLGTYGNAAVTWSNNEFARAYTDNVRNVIGDDTSQTVFRGFGNIIWQVISRAIDCMNPHSDAIQGYGNDPTTNVWRPIAHSRYFGNVLVNEPGRGTLQGFFLQTSASHYQGATENEKRKYKLVGCGINDCLVVGANKLFFSDGQQSTSIKRVLGYTRDTDTSGSVGPATIYIQRGNGNIGPAEIADSITRIKDTIAEGVAGSGYTASSNVENSSLIGTVGARSVPLINVMPNANNAFSTLNDLFLNSARTAGYATRGPAAATLAGLLTATEDGEAWLAFVESDGVELNTQITSSPAYLHGVVGTAHTIAPGPGVEVRTTNVYSGAVLQNWTSSTFTAHSGDIVELRGTTANAPVTPGTFTITLDGQTVSWGYVTKSTATFARSQFAAANIRRGGSASVMGLTGVTNTRRFSVAADLTPMATASAAQNLLTMGTGSAFRLQINTAGRLVFVGGNAGGTTILNCQTATAVSDDTPTKFLMSVDMDLGASLAECVQFYINGSPVGFFGGSTFDVNNGPLNTTTLQWSVGSASGGTLPFKGQLGLLALWPGSWIDWTNPANRAMFSPELFGDGSGFSNGVAPAILTKGVASVLNGSNTANEGTGGAFDNIGTDVVQI